MLALLLLAAAPHRTALAFRPSTPPAPFGSRSPSTAFDPGRAPPSSSTSLHLWWNRDEDSDDDAIPTTKNVGASSASDDEASSNFLDLFGWNKDEDDDDSKAPTTKTSGSEGDDDATASTLLAKSLPPSTASFLKVALPSFLAGTVVTLGFLFLPLLSEYYDAFSGAPPTSLAGGGSASSSAGANPGNNVNQPVILFEAILNDLNDAYVDAVDVQKLFETGVGAMTASLDPYTEFESRSDAREMEELVSGRYGGVGLVIRGAQRRTPAGEAVREAAPAGTPAAGGATGDAAPADGTTPVSVQQQQEAAEAAAEAAEEDPEVRATNRARRRSMEDGIRVVTAFEGYAYDAGFRVGDKLLAIDDFDIKPTTAVDEVRNHLRGDPGTPVSIKFLREGGGRREDTIETIDIQRSVVRIPDVKYFGFIGEPSEGIGYIDLSGFANEAGREVRFAIRALQHGAGMAAVDSPGLDGIVPVDSSKLKGLVLDLRGNPGGLLTSAVDVATLFVPKGSDIVSAKGRGFPETLYRSKTDPALSPTTRLAVLVNEQTASAAEIVTGAVQDLDVGVVVGKGRTFGKGLVQNVQDLPYQTALKYTVAKYYTPSGRCIQSTIYEEGSSPDAENGGARFKSTKVADEDRTVFYTAHGREVKDGGGVEVDYVVEPQKASPLEVILLNSGVYSDYAAEWVKSHELTDQFEVNAATYREFQTFVEKKQSDGDIKLEILYDQQLKALQKKLKASEFDSSRRELDKLRSDIIKDVKKDFITYKAEITQDIEQNILARYLPDSMLIKRGLRSDVQVAKTVKMLKDGTFDKILPRNADGSLQDARGALKTEGQNHDTTSAANQVLTTLNL